jgi:sulfatase maturation enzyme AslB (radical SAM superfamily)
MTYCSAPWTSLQIKTNGDFSFCCVSNDPLGSDLNDKAFVDARSRIIQGETLPSCKTACLDKEELFYTIRKNITNLYPITQPTISSNIDYEQIQYLDLRLSNICNYSCLMCGAQSSHLWGKVKGFHDPVVSWGDKGTKILDLISKLKNLKTVCIAGGEPFFNKPLLLKILDRLDRSVELKFITNVSIFDEAVVKIMNEFKKGKFNASIDGVGKWNDVQRHRANWSEINVNFLNYIKHLHSGWEFNIIPTMSILNFIGLYDLLEWYEFKIKHLRHNINLYYTILTKPDHLSLFIIPTETRMKYNKRIKDTFPDLSIPIKNLIAVTDKEIFKDSNEFFAELKNIERDMNIKVLELLPELKNAL